MNKMREKAYYSERIKRFEDYVDNKTIPENMKVTYKAYIERYKKRLEELEIE